MAATRLFSPLFVLLFVSLVLLGCSGGGNTIAPDENAVRPSITGLSTNSAGSGDQVIITGTGFGNTQSGASASLNGVDFTIVQWTDTQITGTVNGGMTSGIVVVTVNGLSSQSGTEAQLFIPTAPTTNPLISAVSPDYGYASETEVLITGSGFGTSQGSSGVFFSAGGGTTVEADIVTIEIGGVPTPQWTSSSIKVMVPATAITGPVYVMVNGNQSNTRTFTILPPSTPLGGPVITSMDPANGTIGTVVTFVGANFGHSQGSSTIKIGGISMDVISWTDTQIVAKVPDGAESASVRITVSGNFVESGQFVVANAPQITGISPQVLKIGNAVTLYGKNFGFNQGAGKLQIGSSTITPTSWDNNTVSVASLPSFNFQDADAIPVTLTADNGLSDTTTVKLGTNLTVTVQAAPAAGEAGTTAFSFYVAVNGGSGNYGYSLLPDASKPNAYAPESTSNPVTYTYPANAVTGDSATFQTRMKVVDKSNGDTAIVDGPSLFVVAPGTPVITSIELADFNNPIAEAPRNQSLYTLEPPNFAKELYNDFTFYAGNIYFASGLSDISDGVNPIPSTTRVLRNFKTGQSLPRPYGYRYMGDKGAKVQINGINLGDTVNNIFLNSDGQGSAKPGTSVPLENIDSWTPTAIDFYIPQDINADLSGNIVIIVNSNEVKSSSKLICSAYFSNPVQPSPVDPLGPLNITGFDLQPPVVPGITGASTYVFFVVKAGYEDPFGAGHKDNQSVLLVTPYKATVGSNQIQIPQLYPSIGNGDGTGLVEVWNNSFDQAQVVTGTFQDGDGWQLFVWSGAIDEGTSFVKANSGIFSQTIDFTVGMAPPPPGP